MSHPAVLFAVEFRIVRAPKSEYCVFANSIWFILIGLRKTTQSAWGPTVRFRAWKAQMSARNKTSGETESLDLLATIDTAIRAMKKSLEEKGCERDR